MSANNITTEKMNTAGFQTGGYKAPKSEGGGKHTPKRAIIDNSGHTPSRPKKSGSYAKSQNNPGLYDPKK